MVASGAEARDINATVMSHMTAMNPSFSGDINIQHQHVHPPKSDPLDKWERLAKTALKQRYQGQAEIKGLFGPGFKLEESYVNVQMIYTEIKEKTPHEQHESKAPVEEAASGEQRDSSEKDKSSHKKIVRDERLSSFEDLFGEKRVLELTELFKPAQELFKEANIKLADEDLTKKPHFLLVQGRAGIGKTTFMRYVSYQWAKGVLWPEYEWVFLLNLRQLRETHFTQAAGGKQYSLWEWFYQACLVGGDLTLEQFQTLWQQRLRKIAVEGKLLVLMDGYDELPESHPCQAALNCLLQGEYLTMSKLITSRPYGVHNLPQKRRNVEVIGFTNENIERYASLYFEKSGQKERAGRLVSVLKTNPSFWGTAHIPVTLNLLCGLYETESEADFARMRTMSGLYQQMESALFERAYGREVKSAESNLKYLPQSAKEKLIFKHYQQARRILSQLAFQGLSQQQLILSPDFLERALDAGDIEIEDHSQIIQTLLSLAFLKLVADDGSGGYEFWHLTFQEYFAAQHIVRCLNSPNEKIKNSTVVFIQDQLLNPRYQVMFWMVMGLLKADLLQLNAFIQWVNKGFGTHDLLGEYEASLSVKLVEETLTEQTLPLLKPILARVAVRFLWWYEGYKKLPEVFLPHQSTFLQMLSLSPTTQLVIQKETHARVMILKELRSKKIEKKLKVWEFICQIDGVTFIPEVISVLLSALADKDWSVRYAVVRALGQLGEKATPEMMTALLAALTDEEKGVRYAAVDALGQLGEKATPEMMTTLLAALTDEDRGVRYVVIDVLGQLGEKATPEVITALLARITDENEDVRITVARVLGQLGEKATPEVMMALLARITDEDTRVRSVVVEALGQLGEKATPEVMRALLARITDTDKHMRYAVVNVLGQLGEKATPEMMTALSSALTDEERGVRYAVVRALGQLGKKATPEVIMALLARITDEDKDVRYAVVEVLGRLGKKATPEVIIALLTRITDADEHMRYAVARALGQLGEKATPEVMTALLARITDADKHMRYAVVRALGQLGERVTPEVMTALLPRITDEDRGVRYAVVEVLGQLGEKVTPEVMTALLPRITDADRYMRYAAVEALGQLGEKVTPEVMRALLVALTDKERGVQHAVVRALGQLGEKATPEVMTVLSAALTDEDRGVRYAVVDVLGQLGEKVTPEVMTVLSAALTDEERGVRYAVARALVKLGEKVTPEMMTVLSAALTDEDEDVRYTVAHALGQLGEKATPEVVTTLLARITDKDTKVRFAIIEALDKLAERATPEVMTALLPRITDADKHVRIAVAQVLGQLGEKATPEMMTALLAALTDEDEGVRIAVAHALGQLGERVTPEMIMALLARITDKDTRVRFAIIEALDKLAERATPEMIMALLAALTDEDEGVRIAVAHALGKLSERATPEVVTALLARITDADEDVRYTVVHALGQLGEKATPEMMTALSAALTDEDKSVRYAAIEALGQLGERATPEVIAVFLQDVWDVRRYTLDFLIAASKQSGIIGLNFLNLWLMQKEDAITRSSYYYLIAFFYLGLQRGISLSIHLPGDRLVGISDEASQGASAPRPERQYHLTIYIGKDSIEKIITVKQAQILRHAFQKIYEVISTMTLDQMVKAIAVHCKHLPDIKRDKLMKDAQLSSVFVTVPGTLFSSRSGVSSSLPEAESNVSNRRSCVVS